MATLKGDAARLHQPRIFAHIVGWGMAVPDSVLTNTDLEAFVETNDDWIRTRTGIRERRIAGETESSATLGLKAAQRALEVADILPLELDLIICATSTPEHAFPGTANMIQDGLGAVRAGAFDLSAACSGFVYAVNMAAQAIRSGSLDTALVIGSEVMSRVIDWNDRSTCILFGDGAGAVVLKASENDGGILSSVLRSDGSGWDLLALPSIGRRDDNALINGASKMSMNGGEVFKFATRVVHDSILQAVKDAHLTMDDIALIVPHQANARILHAAARSLKIDEDRFMSNLDRYGNTSAASIPIALCEAIDQGRIHAGDNIVFVGFGGGLSWAAMVVQWVSPGDDEPRRFIRHRRQFSYAAARWRRNVLRLSRRLDETVSRIRPERGRIRRLRHKIDRHRLD
jgi:3-oxoacyl-[acyl-carrier-protein] synthase-3